MIFKCVVEIFYHKKFFKYSCTQFTGNYINTDKKKTQKNLRPLNKSKL